MLFSKDAEVIGVSSYISRKDLLYNELTSKTTDPFIVCPGARVVSSSLVSFFKI